MKLKTILLKNKTDRDDLGEAEPGEELRGSGEAGITTGPSISGNPSAPSSLLSAGDAVERGDAPPFAVEPCATSETGGGEVCVSGSDVGDGGVGGSTNFEAENGIRTGELFNAAAAVPEMFNISLSMMRSSAVVSVTVGVVAVVRVVVNVALDNLKSDFVTLNFFDASNSSFFLGCTGIGIRIERNVNDKADCFLSSFNIPQNLGYPKFNRNFMFIAGGTNDDFNAIEIEIFGVE